MQVEQLPHPGCVLGGGETKPPVVPFPVVALPDLHPDDEVVLRAQTGDEISRDCRPRRFRPEAFAQLRVLLCDQPPARDFPAAAGGHAPAGDVLQEGRVVQVEAFPPGIIEGDRPAARPEAAGGLHQTLESRLDAGEQPLRNMGSNVAAFI